MIDLEYLLYGCRDGGKKMEPTWTEVVDFFRDGDFYEEYHLVEAIKKYLVTKKQREWMHTNRVSIEDMLNGRVEGSQVKADVKLIFEEWNATLGLNHFVL